MALNYQNPYCRKTRFEQSHPMTSLSVTSLFAPPISSCPRKKYSKQTWYDYKSSNPELSEKVLYRMHAHFNMLQAKGIQDDPYQHLESCLLGCECRKNPFSRPHLLNQSSYQKYSHTNEDVHWTERKGKMNLIEPHLHKTTSETLKEFGQLRKKQQKQSTHRQRFQLNQNIFDRGDKGFKATFGGSQKVIPNLENKMSFITKKQSQKQQERPTEQQFRQQLNLVESQKQLSKHSSDGTFGFRNSYPQLPTSITYDGKTFFFVKLGIEGK